MAQQVPGMKARSDPGHLQILEDWLRSYGPADLFDENGAPIPEILELSPTGDLRMGANPHVNGGKLRKDLKLPDLNTHSIDVPSPGGANGSALMALGEYYAAV